MINALGVMNTMKTQTMEQLIWVGGSSKRRGRNGVGIDKR